MQEEMIKNFEKPRHSQNQRLVKNSSNENDRAKNSVEMLNKDSQTEKQAKYEKIIYLTIDDGPSTVTPFILKTLEKRMLKLLSLL